MEGKSPSPFAKTELLLRKVQRWCSHCACTSTIRVETGRRALRHCSVVRDELFQSPQAADYGRRLWRETKSHCCWLRLFVFSTRQMNCHTTDRGRHNFRARRRLRSSKEGDRLVKFNFLSFSVSLSSFLSLSLSQRWRTRRDGKGISRGL